MKNEKIIEQLSSLKKYAEEHIISKQEMKDMAIGIKPGIGEIPEFNKIVDIDNRKYMIIYSIDELSETPIRLASIRCKEGEPNTKDVNTILFHLGFIKNKDECFLTSSKIGTYYYSEKYN